MPHVGYTRQWVQNKCTNSAGYQCVEASHGECATTIWPSILKRCQHPHIMAPLVHMFATEREGVSVKILGNKS